MQRKVIISSVILFVKINYEELWLARVNGFVTISAEEDHPSHTVFSSCTSRSCALTPHSQHFYRLASPKVSGKISLDITFPVSSGILWRPAFMLKRKGVDIHVFLWMTVTHFCLKQKLVRWKGRKEENKLQYLIQITFKSLRSGWLIWMDFHRDEGTSTTELKLLQSHRTWSPATPTYFLIDSPQFGRLNKAFGSSATP